MDCGDGLGEQEQRDSSMHRSPSIAELYLDFQHSFAKTAKIYSVYQEQILHFELFILWGKCLYT